MAKISTMKKLLLVVCGIMLTLSMALGAAGCSKETVDEEDMSRWILRFSSEHPNDMENNYLEMTAKELIDRRFEDNMLKITFQWDEKYIEMGNADHGFSLEPTVTLYYVNNRGKRIENGELNGDKYYVVLCGKEKFVDGKYQHTKRVLLSGLYRWSYRILKNDPNGTARIGDIIMVNYFVGNIS